MFSYFARPSTKFNRNKILLTSPGVWRQHEAIRKYSLNSESWQFYTAGLRFKRPFSAGGTVPQSPSTAVETTPDTLQGTIPIPKQRQANKKIGRRGIIRTLDPARFTSYDYVDISSRAAPVFQVVLQHPSPQLNRRPRFNLIAPTPNWSSGVFPPETHGFLYYHVPPHSPPLAGELRFRVTPSESAPFAAGSDLLTNAGLPWRCPLWEIVCRDECRDLAALLVQDDLVSQETLDTALREATATEHGPRTRMMAIPVLSKFGQEFEFRFDGGEERRYLLAGRDRLMRQSFKNVPGVWMQRQEDMKRVNYFPFKGSAVCCFERSALPEHARRRVVVLRVVRLLATDPISYIPAPDGEVYKALWPREGELMKTIQCGQVRPWAVDVDGVLKLRKRHTLHWQQSLRILFENEELYGSPRNSRR